MQEIRKIVLTGGPCAGKTTAMSWVENAFTEKGYKVLFVPETATELISGGVAPWTCGSNAQYQMIQMRLQKFKASRNKHAYSTRNYTAHNTGDRAIFSRHRSTR